MRIYQLVLDCAAANNLQCCEDIIREVDGLPSDGRTMFDKDGKVDRLHCPGMHITHSFEIMRCTSRPS